VDDDQVVEELSLLVEVPHATAEGAEVEALSQKLISLAILLKVNPYEVVWKEQDVRVVSQVIHCEEALLEMDETEGQAGLKHEQEEGLYEEEEGLLMNLLHYLWLVEQAQVSQVEQEQAREAWEDALKV
jgi:hypothetical protein